MVDFKEIVKDFKFPLSLSVGIGLGFLIGFIVGIVSGGFIAEVFFRSIMSGLILGLTLFGVEKVLKKLVPEIFEENSSVGNVSSGRKVDIVEDSDNVSIEDIYLNDIESGSEGQDTKDEIGSLEVSDFDKSMKFSEDTVFDSMQNSSSNELEDIVKDVVEDYSGSEREEVSYEESYSKKESERTFEPINFSTAELGVTKQSVGGITKDFIIPPKGKPIPADYKKLAEAIRTKLKED